MGKKLYVGNLPYSATDQSLADAFSQCGKVESAKVIVDRHSGRSKGFAFVEMSNDDEASMAITKFHGMEYEGRPLTVNEAKPLVPRDPNAGGPPRRSFGGPGGPRGGGGGGGFRGGMGGGPGGRRGGGRF